MAAYYENHKYFYLKRNDGVVLVPLYTSENPLAYEIVSKISHKRAFHTVSHLAKHEQNANVRFMRISQIPSPVRQQGWQVGKEVSPETSATSTAWCVSTSLHPCPCVAPATGTETWDACVGRSAGICSLLAACCCHNYNSPASFPIWSRQRDLQTHPIFNQ